MLHNQNNYNVSRTRCDEGGAPPLPPPPLPPAAPPLPTRPSSGGKPPPAGGAEEGTAEDRAIADAAQNAAASEDFAMNPGPYEQVSMDAKRLVQLDTYDGFRCDINKQVSPYMAAVHSFWLGSTMINDGTGRTSTYAFTTQVADEAGIIMGRGDPGRLSLDGQVHRAILGGLAMAKLQFGVSAEGQSDQLFTELNFGGTTWTGNVKYGSVANSVVYGCNYLQSITPRLCIGGEGLYVGANHNLISNYTIKFSLPAKTGDEDSPGAGAVKPTQQPLPPGMPPPETTGSSSACINLNPSQGLVVVNYKRVVTPNRVTLGAELNFNPYDLSSNVLVGGEFKLARSKINLCIDQDLRLQTLLEAKLGVTQGSPSINCSAEMDHLKEQMRFGYGITVDG